MPPNPEPQRSATTRRSHVRGISDAHDENGDAGGTTTAASSSTPPIPINTAVDRLALFDAGDVVDSPIIEDLGTSSFLQQAEAATWPGILLRARESYRSGDEHRMSINPGHSVAESLILGNSSRTSLAAYTEESSGVDVRGTRSRAQTGESLLSLQPSLLAGPPTMDGALPENDGMQSLRQQLLEIKQLALSTEEKAKRMHELMISDYSKHRALHSPSPPVLQHSSAPQSEHNVLSSLAPPIDPENPYNLRDADFDLTFSPTKHRRTETHGDSSIDNIEDEDLPVLGCAHYTRNVKVQCFDCHRWFPCRHCHDAAPDLPFPHALQRKKTQNMLCMLCRTPQPANEACVNCGEYAAWYYCDKCKLWDNDSNKRIYHCDDCGLCRLGEGLGKDFVHCRRCNVCISISTSASHPCVERATDSDCPLCLLYLFESQMPVVSLPCGHYMHGTCYKDLMAVTYKCPVCSKSAVNMELSWRKLDDEIAMQPMPEEDDELEGILPLLEGAETIDPAAMDIEGDSQDTNAPPLRRPRQAWISCNDCNARCWTPFHWLGLKCTYCGGYNTNQIPPSSRRETEAERLIRQQQSQPHRHDFTGNSVMRERGIGIDAADPTAIVPESTLVVPASPASLSPSSAAYSPGSPGSPPHSPRRYFVRDEDLEPRRRSFTPSTGRFPTPSLPAWDSLPRMPDLPRLPDLPQLPRLPEMALPRMSMPDLPRFPDMPQLELPRFPDMPQLELPRFRAMDMVQMLSRSLSPMRSYMEGLDVRERERVERHFRRAGLGRRSFSEGPGVGGAGEEGRGKKARHERGEFWGSAVLSSGEESSDDDDDVGELDLEDGDSSGSEEGSGSEDDDDEDMEIDEEDGGVKILPVGVGVGDVSMLDGGHDAEAADEDSMELFVHR
ncbi:hypothetical protein B0A48_17472 [Cryoendolithus antarcticus]|uniref:RING-type domain-containing protein n=1 Tax=Cryoendolithus antarcticus TaxID=1507870 RepID=A0A1V8SCK4_9PEZI|nr:hypothetical protein B0A48_17472 [Cryoendolithus antarcticus]